MPALQVRPWPAQVLFIPTSKSQIQDGENEKTFGQALHRNAFGV